MRLRVVYPQGQFEGRRGIGLRWLTSGVRRFGCLAFEAAPWIPASFFLAASFADLAELFGMEPEVLTWQGGIISRPKQNALLVITRPDPASIDYHDFWISKRELVYGGRGQEGDQELTGPNRLLAEGKRINYGFETLGNAQLRFLGTCRTVDHWWARGKDKNGDDRAVLRYLLEFDSDVGTPEPGAAAWAAAEEAAPPSASALEASEGAEKFALHKKKERSRGLAANAKRFWMCSDPELHCCVCNMSFQLRYGDLGIGFIEAHHKLPIAALTEATVMRVEDLAPLCANCHRMVHTKGGRSLDDVKAVIKLE